MPKNKLKNLIYLTLFLLVVSCQKQSAPVVEAEDAWQIRDQERLQACSEVNFTKNLLQHKNTYFLFKCTGWDKKFPSLNRGIQNINPESWNHFFRPIDDVFLNDRQRRDRIFDHIRTLDSKKGLDDLSRVITALNETNFYDALRDMFLCADDPGNPKCANREDRHIEKEEIKKLLTMVEIEPVAIKSVALIVNELMNAIDTDSESLRTEIRKFFYGEDFTKARLRLVSSIAQKFTQGLTPLERDFFKKIPVTRWRENEEPYLYTWIQKPIFTSSIFRRLTNYAVTENPNVIKDLKILKKGYHYPVYCKPYSGNGQIDIDLKTHVDKFLNYVYENDYEQFHDYIIQNVASLQLAITFCPKLKNYSGNIVFVENGEVRRAEHSLNFVELEKKLVDLTSEVPIFDLSKFVTFLASRNLGDIPPNPSFLIDIATEEAAEWLVEIMKIIHSSSDQYFDISFRLLKKLSPLMFDSLGVLTNEFLRKENDPKIRALSKAWLFFDATEQNFLFNFIDRHLQENTNYMLLFKFYATMLEEFATVAPVFKENWTAGEKELEQSYRSLRDIVNNFSGGNVLRDFDEFFSRDHIITIMKVVTRGPELRRVALNRLNANLISRYVSSLPVPTYDITFTEADTEYSRKAKICIDSITNNKSLYFILRNFPADCEFFKHKEISLQTFSWLSEIQSNYDRHFGLETSIPSLLDDRGLLSSDSLNNSIALLRLIDENLAKRLSAESNSGGIKYLMDNINNHLYLVMNQGFAGYIKDVVGIIDSVSSYLSFGDVEHKYLRNRKIFEILSDDGPAIEELSVKASELLLKYSADLDSGKLAPTQFAEETNFSCSSYVKTNIGGIPCPDKNRIKRTLKSMLNDLSIFYDENDTSGLGYFIQALIPNRGLEIPLDSKDSRFKRITVKESVEMVYKMSDPIYPINNKIIEFMEDDEYDAAYDVDNWSGLKYKSTKNEKIEIDDEEAHVNPDDELVFESGRVKVNSLERVEIVMRDVRFDMNYLGAHYKNAVAKADDYNKAVESKLSMFKKCVGLRFCGKFFNKQQVRMAKNAVEAYPSLLDANVIEEFKFGDYMQALLGVFVRSSSKKSQKSSLVKIRVFGKKIEVPWVQTKKQLREHNGKVLSKMSMLSGFSNFSRFVRDRIGRTPEDFTKNLNSKKMKILNESFLYGVDPATAEKELLIIAQSLKGETTSTLTPVDNFIDWIGDMKYQELREVETLILNLSLVGSFIGIGPAETLDYNLSDIRKSRYKESSMVGPLSFLAEVMPTVEKFDKYWPAQFKVIELIRLANKPLSFIAEKLIGGKDLDKSSSYILLNEAYLIFQKLFLESTEFSKSGSHYLSNFIKLKDNSKKIAENLFSIKNYVQFLESKNKENKSGFAILAENVSSIVNDKRFSVKNLRNYLLMTTSTKYCPSTEELNCLANVHFDEPARLLIFAAQKNGSKSTNIERFLDTLFKDYINDYTEMVDNLLPLIRVKLNN